MIDLSKEKNSVLTAQERYEICSFAIEAAETSGFLNSFIFERAIYCYTTIMLLEDGPEKDNVRALASENILECWSHIVDSDILKDVQAQYSDIFDIIAEEGWTWFKEYGAYITSARGILSFVEQFSGDILANAAETFQSTVNNTEVNNVIDIANKWGLNNEASLLDE